MCKIEMASQQIRKYLDNILHFMEPHWQFVNCHMVNYLTDSFWEKYIPIDIQKSIKTEEDIESAIEQVFWQQDKNSSFTELLNFVMNFHQYRLENMKDIVHSKEDFHKILDIHEKNNSQLSIKEFMSEKKRHEVEITAELIADLMKSTNENFDNFLVIDAGDGKGYLSSRLALEYDVKVLGIDSNKINTEGAQNRSKKLQKVWSGLTTRADILSKGQIPPRRAKKPQKEFPKIEKPQNYKTINKFITPNVDLKSIVKEEFNLSSNSIDKNLNICLTGLHTCGNLSSTCLKVFNEQLSIKFLCNIGCCYHLINEQFISDTFFVNKNISEKNTDYGFPLSQYLTELKFKMGRNARMLSVQSIHRILTKKELSGKSLYYRALLETVIAKKYPNLQNSVQVGKIKKFNNFQDYLQKCGQKLDINDLEIQHLEKTYLKDEKFLNLFYLIRINFAPILETIILLDRLLYLKENGYEKSFLISLFDPVISPRCYGIVAIRE